MYSALKKIKRGIPYVVYVYIASLAIWLFLLLIEKTYGVGDILGTILILLFWGYIAPIKLFIEGFSIASPSFLPSSSPIGIDVWIIAHSFNIAFLLVLSAIFATAMKLFKRILSKGKR